MTKNRKEERGDRKQKIEVGDLKSGIGCQISETRWEKRERAPLNRKDRFHRINI